MIHNPWEELQPPLTKKNLKFLGRLHDLRSGLGHDKLGAEDFIPEAARDSEAVLVVHEVVLHVPFLCVLVEFGELGVVEEVVRQVVYYVSEHPAAEDGGAHVPVE